MRVLSKIKLVFLMFSLACGLSGMSGSAMALTTEQASICKPYGASNAAGLYSYTSGAWNYSGGSLSVACPVVRTVGAPTSGYSVWVDGTAAAGTATCSLYSYNYDNTYMGSISFSTTGKFSRLLTLPATQVSYYSSQMVYCYLPVNGAVFDVEPVQ